MLDTTQPQVGEAANQPYTQDAAQDGAAQAGTQDAEAFLTVRYNKEELPLSREAAAEYAQKGLNYDKLSGRLEEASQKLEAYESLGALARELAGQNGVSEKEALGALQQRMDREREAQTAVNAQLDAFLALYPDTDPAALPEAVMAAWKNGVPLTQAYAAHLDAAGRDAQARQTNARNAAASMGGARGTDAAAPRPLSEDAISQMSPAELERDHSRIWAFLTGRKE